MSHASQRDGAADWTYTNDPSPRVDHVSAYRIGNRRGHSIHDCLPRRSLIQPANNLSALLPVMSAAAAACFLPSAGYVLRRHFYHRLRRTIRTNPVAAAWRVGQQPKRQSEFRISNARCSELISSAGTKVR